MSPVDAQPQKQLDHIGNTRLTRAEYSPLDYLNLARNFARLCFAVHMPLRAKIVPKMSSSSSSSYLESQLAAAVQEGKVPHAVVYAASRDGACQRRCR